MSRPSGNRYRGVIEVAVEFMAPDGSEAEARLMDYAEGLRTRFFGREVNRPHDGGPKRFPGQPHFRDFVAKAAEEMI